MSCGTKKLLRTKGVADLLGVNASTVRLIEGRGLLHAVRDWSGHRRFEEDAVLAFRERLLAGAFDDEWAKTLGANSINKVYATINKIFKFARKFNVKVNPMLDVERKRETVSLEEVEAAALGEITDLGEESKAGDGTLRAIGADEVLSAVELGKLIEASQPGLERTKHMTAVFSGARHGELNGLRWDCVNLKRGRVLSIGV